MNQTIGVNITPQSFQPTLHYSQGDVGRVFVINVTDYDIPTGATVTCVATKPSGMGFTVSGTVSGNSVTFTSTAEMTDEWGRFPAEIRIASGNTLLGTANFLMIGEKDPHPASTIDGTQEELIPQLTLLVNRVEAAAESVHDLTVSATTLTAGSDATATYDSTNNSIAFGIPRGADGDVTRSEFNDLKSDIAKTFIYENRFTSANWEKGYIYPTDGSNSGSNNTNIRLNSTSFIENAKSIKAKSGYKFAVAAFDSEGTYVGTWNGSTWAKNWGWKFITKFSLVEYPNYKFRVTLLAEGEPPITIAESANLLVSYKDASQNLYDSVESLGDEIKSLKGQIVLDGMGDTFVGNVVYDNVVSANAVYRLHIKSWSVDGITPSSTATLFSAGYEDNGTYTSLIQLTTNAALSEYYDIYIPSTANEPKISVGGRIELGTTAFVSIEPLEINDIINADYNRPYDAYAVLNGKGNTFTSVLTDYTLYKGDIYRVYINKWNHTQATTPSSYVFQVGYEDDNENRAVLAGCFVGDTIPDFIDFELPYDVESGTLFVGGRTDNNGFAIVSIKNLSEQLPDFVEQAVSNLNNSLMAHQTSNSISFPFITDIHIGKGNLMDDVLGAMLRSKYAINAINKVNPLDFCVFNGDYLFNTGADSKAKLLNYYDQLERAFSDLDVIKWMGKGNHDINDANPSNALSDEEYYQHCFKYSAVNRFVMDYDELQKCYGYYDDTNRRIRFIFVNTVDIPSSGYLQQHTKGISNKQLNFIAKALEFDNEENWGVVFVSHHALQNNAVLNPTDSDDGYLTSEHGGTPLMGIINAFVNKTSYSFSQNDDPWVYQVSVDYSGNASSEVIAMFSGHMHRDCLTTVNGYVMMSVSSGGLTVEGYDANGNQISKSSKTITETSWDVITIDRLNKMIYADRYGGGISRSIAYGN